MAKKDPAFLFYPSAFIMGTMFMSNEQIGIYIRLLCVQHQHGGLIKKTDFNSMIGNNDIIKTKFIETDEGFYNERLMIEIEKRSIKSTNLSANAKIMWEKRKQMQSNCITSADANVLPTKDTNTNTNKDVNVIKDKIEIVFNSWNAFAELFGLVKINKLTDSRKSHVRKRLAEKEFDFDAILEKIKDSLFMLGNNDKNWKVDFDFIFKNSDNYIKILEGKYNNGISKTGIGASPNELAEIVANRFKRQQQ